MIVGVDEAGRGPLAGPVTVGSFSAPLNFRAFLLKNIFDNKLRDSKKLSEKVRVEIYKKLLKLKKEDKVFFSCIHISHKVIDKKGISHAVRKGIERSLRDTDVNSAVHLDGLLKAPERFKSQETIVKGDEKDIFIACASIVAKVRRDALIIRLAKKFPLYSLEIHKGYGTALHRQLLNKHGLSELHRVSFCANIRAW